MSVWRLAVLFGGNQAVIYYRTGVDKEGQHGERTNNWPNIRAEPNIIQSWTSHYSRE